jgi:hypothetical protein
LRNPRQNGQFAILAFFLGPVGTNSVSSDQTVSPPFEWLSAFFLSDLSLSSFGPLPQTAACHDCALNSGWYSNHNAVLLSTFSPFLLVYARSRYGAHRARLRPVANLSEEDPMRSVKVLFVLGTAILLAGAAFRTAVVTADGGKPLPRPPLVLLADGGKPLPRPPSTLVADGGKPLPRPPQSQGFAA